MPDRDLRVAKVKVQIYRGACIEAGGLLAGSHSKGTHLVAEAIKILTEATHAAARVDSWVPIKHVSYGALFESQCGLRYIKTVQIDMYRAVCIALDTGMQNQLDVDMLVRVITIKEDENGPS